MKIAIESSFMVPVVTFGHRIELTMIIALKIVESLFILSNKSAIVVDRWQKISK